MHRFSYGFNKVYVCFSLINLASEYNESKHLFTKIPTKAQTSHTSTERNYTRHKT